MNMRSIEVPDYVWQEFRKPLITDFWTSAKRERSLQRVYKLAAHALKDFDVGRAQWKINDGQYRSQYCLEPVGFHRVGDLFYVYGENRGAKSPIAIFKSMHSAVEYFVWLISNGKCNIDWSLFLEMEP
jgi:hypothetical protein